MYECQELTAVYGGFVLLRIFAPWCIRDCHGASDVFPPSEGYRMSMAPIVAVCQLALLRSVPNLYIRLLSGFPEWVQVIAGCFFNRIFHRFLSRRLELLVLPSESLP